MSGASPYLDAGRSDLPHKCETRLNLPQPAGSAQITQRKVTAMLHIITLGDIGEDQREYEFEPLTAPLEAPVEAPVQVPSREAVPA